MVAGSLFFILIGFSGSAVAADTLSGDPFGDAQIDKAPEAYWTVQNAQVKLLESGELETTVSIENIGNAPRDIDFGLAFYRVDEKDGTVAADPEYYTPVIGSFLLRYPEPQTFIRRSWPARFLSGTYEVKVVVADQLTWTIFGLSSGGRVTLKGDSPYSIQACSIGGKGVGQSSILARPGETLDEIVCVAERRHDTEEVSSEPEASPVEFTATIRPQGVLTRATPVASTQTTFGNLSRMAGILNTKNSPLLEAGPRILTLDLVEPGTGIVLARPVIGSIEVAGPTARFIRFEVSKEKFAAGESARIEASLLTAALGDQASLRLKLVDKSGETCAEGSQPLSQSDNSDMAVSIPLTRACSIGTLEATVFLGDGIPLISKSLHWDEVVRGIPGQEPLRGIHDPVIQKRISMTIVAILIALCLGYGLWRHRRNARVLSVLFILGCAGALLSFPSLASAAPTASLTVNGATDIYVSVGDTVNYAWDSTGAVRWGSNWSAFPESPCGGGGVWVANSASGSSSATIEAFQTSSTGCAYVIAYSATDSSNVTAYASITVRVRPTPTNAVCSPTRSPQPCQAGIISGGIRVSADRLWFEWTCAGFNGGTNANCREAIPNAAIPGRCSSPPTHYDCIDGTAKNQVETTISYTWACSGQNGGQDSPWCIENKPDTGGATMDCGFDGYSGHDIRVPTGTSVTMWRKGTGVFSICQQAWDGASVPWAESRTQLGPFLAPCPSNGYACYGSSPALYPRDIICNKSSTGEQIAAHCSVEAYEPNTSTCGNGMCESGESCACEPSCSGCGGGGGGNIAPIGFLESANCNQIVGYACDGSSWTTSIDVHLYDGLAGSGGTFLGSLTANLSRPDIAALCGGNQLHGFSYPTPASLKDGVNHVINAYAINTPLGTNPRLSGSPKAILCSGGGSSSSDPIATIVSPLSNSTDGTTHIVWGSIPVPFVAQGFDPDGVVNAYEWSTGTLAQCQNHSYPPASLLGAQGPLTGNNIPSAVQSHSFTPGSRTVYLSVRDNSGRWSTNCPAIEVLATPPLAAPVFSHQCLPADPNLDPALGNQNVLLSFSDGLTPGVATYFHIGIDFMGLGDNNNPVNTFDDWHKNGPPRPLPWTRSFPYDVYLGNGIAPWPDTRLQATPPGSGRAVYTMKVQPDTGNNYGMWGTAEWNGIGSPQRNGYFFHCPEYKLQICRNSCASGTEVKNDITTPIQLRYIPRGTSDTDTLVACFNAAATPCTQNNPGDDVTAATAWSIADTQDAVNITGSGSSPRVIRPIDPGAANAPKDEVLARYGVYQSSIFYQVSRYCGSLICDPQVGDNTCSNKKFDGYDLCGPRPGECQGGRICDFNWKEVAP